MSEETNDIDIPLDDIFDGLGDIDLTDAERALRERGKQTRALAKRALATWHATRRVLYITRTECKNCGQIHDSPSAHLLTEYQSGDGTKKWAKADILSSHLPIEQEVIGGHTADVCQFCLPTFED